MGEGLQTGGQAFQDGFTGRSATHARATLWLAKAALDETRPP